MTDPASRKKKEGEKDSKPARISRRKFLSYAGILGATPLVGQIQNIQKKIIPQKQITLPQTGLMVKAFRPDDLLYLDFEFINLKLVNLPRPHLVRENRGQPAYLIVHFPPQSIAEEAFYEGNTPAESETPKPLPVFSRISGPTRLSFLIPDEINEIPLTLESLLAWHLYQPSLVPVALPPSAPGQTASPVPTVTNKPATATRSLISSTGQSTQNLYLKQSRAAQTQITQVAKNLLKPTPPGKIHTAIEMPYRLILSPNPYNIWLHPASPVSTSGWTELWHTRLAVLNQDGSLNESDHPYLTVRAVWSPDVDLNDLVGPDPEHKTRPRLSLDPNDRHQIVHLSSNFTLRNPDKTAYEPLPIKVNRLMLSPLGAWLDSIGNWPSVGSLKVATWRHLATMGRDHYVKVVYRGYLLPFGHQAALIKVTERKFYKAEDGQNIAYLFQKMYITVRNPEKTFPAPFQLYDGREVPFKLVKITTLQTPPLDDPASTQILPDSGQQAFWPKVGGKDFQFHIAATDVEDNEVEFNMPMVFINNDFAFNPAKLNQVIGVYNSKSSTPVEKREPNFMGQTVAFAPEKKKSDTSFEVEAITWKLKEAGPNSNPKAFEVNDQPMCFPALEEATVAIPALKNLVGFDSTVVRYPDVYIQNAFSPAGNKGELFLQVMNPPKLDFAAGGKAEKSGGIATPSFSIVGVSRILGPVGAGLQSSSAEPAPGGSSGPLADPAEDVLKEALDEIINGKFDPKKFFTDQAKILGGILLQDVIDEVNDFTSPDNTGKALNIKTEQVYESDGKTPAGVKTLLKWTPGVHDVLIFIADRDGTKSALTLDVETVAYFNGKDPTYRVKGELTDFTLDMIKGLTTFILVKFNKFTFTAEKGKKTDVDPKIASIDFQGPLKFIKELLDKIPLPGSSSDGEGGFGGKPVVKVDAAGARLGYALSIPDVAFGVFTLQNLKFTGEIYLPFTGDPVSLRFAFNEKNNPFLVTVAMFGGGGYFAIVLQPNGIKLIEGALEFGGSFAMNLGVASGGVTLMAGIYFKYEDDAITITGYVRCTGELDVMGLISISAEFYLALTYEEARNRVWGQASLTVKIKIIFFSTKVTLKVEREFGHSPAPLFCDLMEEKDWLAYCEAFA
ncbi:MAG: hypothetical protein H5U06_04260 [Candidatus Aminicenantes bacterium]|nr:hypothetical protein [Candidatus Aminicenantes bacterium]